MNLRVPFKPHQPECATYFSSDPRPRLPYSSSHIRTGFPNLIIHPRSQDGSLRWSSHKDRYARIGRGQIAPPRLRSVLSCTSHLTQTPRLMPRARRERALGKGFRCLDRDWNGANEDCQICIEWPPPAQSSVGIPVGEAREDLRCWTRRPHRSGYSKCPSQPQTIMADRSTSITVLAGVGEASLPSSRATALRMLVAYHGRLLGDERTNVGCIAWGSES
jgi:hypothetical protein